MTFLSFLILIIRICSLFFNLMKAHQFFWCFQRISFCSIDILPCFCSLHLFPLLFLLCSSFFLLQIWFALLFSVLVIWNLLSKCRHLACILNLLSVTFHHILSWIYCDGSKQHWLIRELFWRVSFSTLCYKWNQFFRKRSRAIFFTFMLLPYAVPEPGLWNYE